jgi:hypothetical protein
LDGRQLVDRFIDGRHQFVTSSSERENETHEYAIT